MYIVMYIAKVQQYHPWRTLYEFPDSKRNLHRELREIVPERVNTTSEVKSQNVDNGVTRRCCKHNLKTQVQKNRNNCYFKLQISQAD